MSKVYANKPPNTLENNVFPAESRWPQADRINDRVPFLGEEVDSYMSQIGTLMDDGTLGIDETLNDWFNALIQGTETSSASAGIGEMLL